MASWPHAHVYPGDLVERTGSAVCGYVVVVGWDEEHHAPDSDDEGALDAYEGLDAEAVRVEWASGDVDDVRPNELRVLSRALLPRSVVARVDAPYAQAGTVTHVTATATLRSLSDPTAVHEGVPTSLLTHASPPLGRLVVRTSPWSVGVLVDVDVALRVAFRNGAVVEVASATPEDVMPADEGSDDEGDEEAERWGEDALYYPGLVVSARSEFWRSQHVVSGRLPVPPGGGGRARGRGGRGGRRAAPARELSGTVVAVTPTHGVVEWLEGAGVIQEDAERVLLSTLHVLHGQDAFFLAGDRICLGPDALPFLADRNLPMPAPSLSAPRSLECAFEVVSLTTLADVQWQDGSTTERVASPELFLRPLDRDFYPGVVVAYRLPPGGAGVVTAVSRAEQRVHVDWQGSPAPPSPVPYTTLSKVLGQAALGDVALQPDQQRVGRVVGYDGAKLRVRWQQGAVLGEADVVERESVKVLSPPNEEDEEEEMAELMARLSMRDDDEDEDEVDDEGGPVVEEVDSEGEAPLDFSWLKPFQGGGGSVPELPDEEDNDQSGDELADAYYEAPPSTPEPVLPLTPLPVGAHHFASAPASDADECEILVARLSVLVPLVRCEGRPDLARLLVPGPVGTPYHGSLLVLDAHLTPPRMALHVHTAGQRVHPLIEADGCMDVGELEAEGALKAVLSWLHGTLALKAPDLDGDAAAGSHVERLQESVAEAELALVAALTATLTLVRSPPEPLGALFAAHWAHVQTDVTALVRACEELYDEAAPTLGIGGIKTERHVALFGAFRVPRQPSFAFIAAMHTYVAPLVPQ